MSERTELLAERVRSFADEVIAFVEKMTDSDWIQTCEWEQWTAGMTAYHIGAGHLAIFELADRIVKGGELPQLTMDQINAMSNQQAEEKASCTKEEALERLRGNRDRMISYITGLNDNDLDLKGSMPAFGGEVTTEQIFEYIVFENAANHFDSIKKAVRKA